MRAEMVTGWFIADDLGWELEATVAGAGYIVAWPDESMSPRGTLWGRVTNTWFVYKDSSMVAERYWLGPFVRGEAGTELLGRYKDHGIATLNRGNLDVGYRFSFGAPTWGSIGFGYGVTHDRVASEIDHGVRIQFEIGMR